MKLMGKIRAVRDVRSWRCGSNINKQAESKINMEVSIVSESLQPPSNKDQQIDKESDKTIKTHQYNSYLC